jgi:hypothetical protein
MDKGKHNPSNGVSSHVPSCTATEKGFDWLGYHISRTGLRVATTTLQHFVTRIRRLYEQSQEEPLGSSRLGDYVLRWVRWLTAGLPWDVWGRHPCSAHSLVSAVLPIGLRTPEEVLQCAYVIAAGLSLRRRE